MNKIEELFAQEIDLVSAAAGTDAYNDAKEIGKRVGQAIEDFFEGVISAWTDGK